MKLVILDRDGVINEDSDNFIKSVDEWIPIPGSLESIAQLKQAGYTVAIATNQSGVARGLYSLDELHAMHQKLAKLLDRYGVAVDAIEFCPHLAADNCQCRKPLPGMYQSIALQFKSDLTGVPVIGDSLRDLQAAAAVGASPLLVRTGKGLRTLEAGGLPPDTQVFDNLAEAVDFLISKDSA